MEKKYSVNMENDEVVSVEVDGVKYEDPDQILDESDRDKILELIDKATDENFDDDLDKEFEANVREMQRQSAGGFNVFIFVFMAVGLLMLGIAGVSTVSTLRSLAREASAPGQVVDMTVRQSYDSETKVTSEYYYPVVEFNLPDGTPKRVQLSEGSWPPEYEVGQPVTILYDSQKPLDARIQSTSSTVLKWLLPGITGTIGIIFLGVTLAVYLSLRPATEELNVLA